MLEPLLERFRHRDRRALARILTLVARGEHLTDIAGGVLPPASPCKTIAFTGSGGVGKSTVIGKLIDLVLAEKHRLAVLACDPQSPLSGGALLGDRFRMGSHDDDRLYIRSLAALSGHSALADHLPLMIRLLEAFGFDVIFVETVGSGQSDTAVRAVADVVVLLLQPESGDDLQWEKAGVLEVADLVVVHKADLPGADQTAAQVRAALNLSMQKAIPLVRASSKTGAGLEDLWQVIQSCPSRRDWRSAVQEVLRFAQDALAERFSLVFSQPMCQAIVKDWQQGKLSAKDAGAQLLAILISPGKPE